MKRLLFALTVLVVLSVSVSAQGPIKGSAASMKKPMPDLSAGPKKRCHVNGELPDSNCTPGVTNPNIKQSNISQNICKKGWAGVNPYTGKQAKGTATLRPPTSYTSKLKAIQMKEYGLTGSMSDYEEDHLISLQLGGNPVDPRNLWPEKPASPNPKDGFENYLKAMVCQKKMTLAEAQQEIATDWFKFWTDAGKPKGAAAANAKHHANTGRRHHRSNSMIAFSK